jgi:hypothetical protein
MSRIRPRKFVHVVYPKSGWRRSRPEYRLRAFWYTGYMNRYRRFGMPWTRNPAAGKRSSQNEAPH